MSHYYTVEDIESIISTATYKITEQIQTIFKFLETELEPYSIADAELTAIPQTAFGMRTSYKSHEPHYEQKRRKPQAPTIIHRSKPKNEITDQDWSEIRNFKTTKMDTKEGVEKQINEIRMDLNKISKKNYDVQKDAIIQKITIVENDSAEHLNQIAQAIFDIASSNKFFSELYAALYKELIGRFAIFATILTEFVSKFTDTIKNIQYVDPDKDYDGFCNYTKINDQRKATSMFIVNLMKTDILTKDTVIHIIQFFIEQTKQGIDMPGHTNEAEEITENIFILVTQSREQLEQIESWSAIIEQIAAFSKMKTKEHPSLSNRIVFKYLDIVDTLKKAKK
jgi:hypothetical protein